MEEGAAGLMRVPGGCGGVGRERELPAGDMKDPGKRGVRGRVSDFTGKYSSCR